MISKCPALIAGSMAIAAAIFTAAATESFTPPLSRAEDAAADEGGAIRTDVHRCQVRDLRRGDPFLHCVAIYRNASDRPVFDIAIEAEFNGHRLPFKTAMRSSVQTRSALAPGERGAFIGHLDLPAGITVSEAVQIRYRASATGDPRALDVPRPQVQYIDREDLLGQLIYHVEVRNVDGRPWAAIDPAALSWLPGDVARPAVMIALDRGQIVDWTDRVVRHPRVGIAAGGRAFYKHALPTYATSDEAHFFPREIFRPAESNPANARWELRGLDTWVETEEVVPGFRPTYMWFQATIYNPSNVTLYGDIYVVPRRADFHTIGGVDCGFAAVDPGVQRVCRARMILRSGHNLDDVEFTTVELGLPTACRQATTTTGPIPTPAAIPHIVGRVWLPWVHVDKLAPCP